MDTPRKLAIATGICFLLTHVTSIPAAFLYDSILNHTNYVLGSGSDTQVLVGAFLEVICALGIVGTSVSLFPVVRRWSEGGALGYVGLRTLEASVIVAGVLPILTVVALRQHLTGDAGADSSALAAVGNGLVEMHKWTRLLGPGLICGTNTTVMAYLLYRSRLVPRIIPVLGLIGGPAIFMYNAARVFGVSEHTLGVAAIAVIPIFAWEVSLALRLITKGFDASTLTADVTRPVPAELVPAM